MKYYEKPPSTVKHDPEIRNYRQVFLPTEVVTRAPWHWIWLFYIQRAIGWIWLRRMRGRPHPWDKKANP